MCPRKTCRVIVGHLHVHASGCSIFCCCDIFLNMALLNILQSVYNYKVPVQKTSHCYFTRCHETLTRTVFLETLWKLFLKKTAGKNASLWKKPWKLQGHEKVWNVFWLAIVKVSILKTSLGSILYISVYMCVHMY